MEEFIKNDAADWNDSVQMHYAAATVYSWNNMEYPDLPETKVPAIAKLVELRDTASPGKEVWNTEDTVPANSKTPEIAAVNLPRMYISQIAAGVDKIYLFSQTGTNDTRHDVVACLDENGHPFPPSSVTPRCRPSSTAPSMPGRRLSERALVDICLPVGRTFVLAGERSFRDARGKHRGGSSGRHDCRPHSAAPSKFRHPEAS